MTFSKLLRSSRRVSTYAGSTKYLGFFQGSVGVGVPFLNMEDFLKILMKLGGVILVLSIGRLLWLVSRVVQCNEIFDILGEVVFIRYYKRASKVVWE